MSQHEMIVIVDEADTSILVIETGPVGPVGPAGVGVTSTYSRAEADAILSDHVSDETPHPAYDDLPSLTLLFENRLI